MNAFGTLPSMNINHDVRPLLAVTGSSGVGKTTLVDALVTRHPHTFGRVRSYTTRPKRLEADSEYVHVGIAELEQLLAEGVIRYIDAAYGHHYAMDSRHIEELRTSMQIPVKEIHPNNLEQLELSYAPTLSVLITADGHLQRDHRVERKTLQVEHLDQYDVVFRNCWGVPLDQNLDEFCQTMSAITVYQGARSQARSESQSKTGYDRIAPFFTDEDRPTTRNFHDLSLPFWRRVIERSDLRGMRVLEVAPGAGWLRTSVAWPEVEYFAVDLSPEMLQRNPDHDRCFNASVRAIPFETGSFDAVFASLADPCLTPAAVCEIRRVLRSGGIFALTTPHADWAEALRPDNQLNTTSFAVGDELITVPSYVYSEFELKRMLEICGLHIRELSSVDGSMLRGDISPALSRAAAQVSRPLSSLAIIACARGVKP